MKKPFDCAVTATTVSSRPSNSIAKIVLPDPQASSGSGFDSFFACNMHHNS